MSHTDGPVRVDSASWPCPVAGCGLDMKAEYPTAEDPAGALVRHLLDADDHPHRAVVLAPAMLVRGGPSS